MTKTVAYAAIVATCAACTGDDVSRAVPLDASTVDSSIAAGDASTSGAGDRLVVTRTDFVEDQVGTSDGGARIDPSLVNPWGLAFDSLGAAWVADNGAGVATAYDATGAAAASTIMIAPPSDAGVAAPSGVVANATAGDFAGDELLFATEDGTVAGWRSGSTATLRIERSTTGAVYKGLDILETPNGRVLCVANFHAGSVDVFDSTFQSTVLSENAFVDPNMAAGFAPFNVLVAGSNVFVAYAKQDAVQHDDVAGEGNGLIDVYDETGALVRRLVTGSVLDSPWGMALAPADYATFAGALLVANFGDGTMHAFDPATGQLRGQLATANDGPLSLDGLWSIRFGQDQPGESHTQLFFTAGVGAESHGLFGRLDLSP